MVLRATKLAADVRGDLMQFSMGMVNTVNREDILDLCDQFDAVTAENERLTQADRQWADHVKRLADERDRLRDELRTCQETLTACLEST